MLLLFFFFQRMSNFSDPFHIAGIKRCSQIAFRKYSVSKSRHIADFLIKNPLNFIPFQIKFYSKFIFADSY